MTAVMTGLAAAPRLAEGLGTILLFLAPGVALGRLLLVRANRGTFRLGVSYLLGIVWVAGGLYVASHVFGTTLRRTSVLALAALPVLGALAVRLKFGPRTEFGRARRPRPREPLVVLACCVGAFVSAGVLAEALTNPVTDWDGVMTWTTQARFVRAARAVAPPALKDTRFFIWHPRYPLLMPLAQVAALETFDTDDDRVFRPLYAALFPVAITLVFAAAARLAGRRVAACAAIAAAFLPVLALPDGGASGCYSDLPVACFGGAALVVLLSRGLARKASFAAGLLLTGAVLSKSEGVVLALAVLAAAAWVRRRRGASFATALVPATALTLASFVFLVSWKAGLSPHYDENYGAALRDLSAWAHAPGRLAAAVPTMLREMVLPYAWGWFFFGVPLAAVAGRNAFARTAVAPYLIAAAGPIGVALGAYALHFDPPQLAASTWTRFLIQASVPLAAVFAACVREAGRRRSFQTIAASS